MERHIRALLRELRAEVKPLPSAARALERVEARLSYLLRLLDAWDATHTRRAEALLAAGRTEAAAAAAAMVFDEERRHSLYDRSPVLGDTGAAERTAEATRKATQQAQEAQQQARRDAAAEARVIALKGALRASWQGTAADFERNWPTLRDEALRRDALAQRDAALEARRAAYRDLL